MATMLTHSEWDTKKAPVYWASVKISNRIRRTIAFKWIEDNLEGWCYHEDGIFAFEHEEDRTMFLIWVPSVEDQIGSI